MLFCYHNNPKACQPDVCSVSKTAWFACDIKMLNRVNILGRLWRDPRSCRASVLKSSKEAARSRASQTLFTSVRGWFVSAGWLYLMWTNHWNIQSKFVFVVFPKCRRNDFWTVFFVSNWRPCFFFDQIYVYLLYIIYSDWNYNWTESLIIYKSLLHCLRQQEITITIFIYFSKDCCKCLYIRLIKK